MSFWGWFWWWWVFVSHLDRPNLLLQGFSFLYLGGKTNFTPPEFCFERVLEEAETPFSAEEPEEEAQAVLEPWYLNLGVVELLTRSSEPLPHPKLCRVTGSAAGNLQLQQPLEFGNTWSELGSYFLCPCLVIVELCEFLALSREQSLCW